MLISCVRVCLCAYGRVCEDLCVDCMNCAQIDYPYVPMMIGLAKTVVNIVLDMAFLAPWRITAGMYSQQQCEQSHCFVRRSRVCVCVCARMRASARACV